jgi:hypothetical protein
MPSIPAMHVSTFAKVKGDGTVFIASRQDAVSSGKFSISLSVHFDPAVDAYPAGTLTIKSDMSDSAHGSFIATSIELINAYGKHNPTVIITGQCKTDITSSPPVGCRYWVMIANNKSSTATGTPDVVGFLINDRNGNRIAYGMGPLDSGDIDIAPL